MMIGPSERGPSPSSRLGMTDGKGSSPRYQAAKTCGQAAARGQFALFGKGRALKQCYQRHGAGSKGQGADGAKRRSVIRVKGSASLGTAGRRGASEERVRSD